MLNPGSAHRDFPNIDGEIEAEPSIIIFDTTKISYQLLDYDLMSDIFIGNFMVECLEYL